jgi:hypothetical protein
MENLSIHPRCWPHARPDWQDKQNTCKQKKRSTVERAIAGIEGHLERHPHDAMSRRHLDSLKAKLASLPAERAKAA